MNMHEAAGKRDILIVDDEKNNRSLIQSLLHAQGYQTRQAVNGVEALDMVGLEKPDLILLDIMMPVMDGFQTAEKLKENPDTRPIPVIMVTALEDRKSCLRGLKCGVEEFITKPVDGPLLSMRVRNLLRLKDYGDLLKRHNELLEEQVEQRTKELRSAFVESIYTLMRAAEYRDDDTGAHVRRISHYCRRLSEILGKDREFCKQIFYASPMHDIGKIGIPDHILLKAGGLTPEEWEVMKTHTTIGSDILEGATSPYLVMGREIALNHHERWDGGGYPRGILAEAIPLSARIMQICDVYDALRSERPYKKKFDHRTATKIISEGDGRTRPQHFDPDILAAFQSVADDFDEIFSVRTDEASR